MDDLIKELNKKYKNDYTGLLQERASIECQIEKNKLNDPNTNFALLISIVSLGFAVISLIATMLVEKSVEKSVDVEFVKTMVIGSTVAFIIMCITVIVIVVFLLQSYKSNVGSLTLRKYAVDYLLEKSKEKPKYYIELKGKKITKKKETN